MAKKFIIVKKIETGVLYKLEQKFEEIQAKKYTKIATIIKSEKSISLFNDRRCSLVSTDTGIQYEVFSDCSARIRN